MHATTKTCIELGPAVVNPDVKLTFRYLPGEYVRAVNAHQRLSVRLLPDLTIAGILAGAGFLTILFGTDQYFWLGVLMCGTGLAFCALVIVILVVLPRAMLASKPKLHQEYQLTFSDQGVRFRTDSIDSTIGWSIYERAVEVRNFYLLYWARRQFTVIPKRAFETSTDMLTFEALLFAHISKIDRRV